MRDTGGLNLFSYICKRNKANFMNIKRPLILVSNDDGYHAKGINCLVDMLRDMADIVVCAPESARSGFATAFSATVPLRLKQRRKDEGFEMWSCNGTPVDCVKIALEEFFADRRPDMVIGGINHGDNGSVNVHYSGTMGVTLEGCMKYIPSVGFSLCDHRDDADFTPLRPYVRQIVRKVLDEAGYTEVETPTLQSIAGGASARPFITHFNALDQDMYMRIATELYLKRLIVGGFEGVYEIGKNFRNEGMDRNHNPEFTCMELYVQYKDYNWMMSFTEKLLETICIAVNGKPEREIDGNIISFKAPYRRLPILDAIKEKTGFDCNGKTEEEIRAFCLEKGMDVDETMGKGKLIDELFGEFCEGTFIQPTFITDYPVEMSPLTKMHRSKPGLTERFELMVNGKELANAYSELNDPIDQEERFIDQMKLADKGDDEAMIIDQDFLRALQYGMPPTSGIGIGIDRLVMLMTGKTFIQEVLFFPQMKPEKKMPQSTIKEWAEIGVPEDWAYVLRKAGFNLISDIREQKAQGLQQKIGEINKKYKLGYDKPSVDDIQKWIDAAAASATTPENAE